MQHAVLRFCAEDWYLIRVGEVAEQETILHTHGNAEVEELLTAEGGENYVMKLALDAGKLCYERCTFLAEFEGPNASKVSSCWRSEEI